MNKKTLGLLKIAYAKVVTFPPVAMASNKRKSDKKNKAVTKYNQYLSSLYSPFSNLNIEETCFKEVSLRNNSSSDFMAGLDVFGSRKSMNQDEAFSLSKGLNPILADEDISLRLSIMDSGIDDGDQILRDQLKLYTLTQNQSYLFHIDEFTLAAVGLVIHPDFIVNEKVIIPNEVLANMAYGRSNADYTLVYALNQCDKSYEKIIMKTLVDLGADYVFATNDSTIDVGVPIKRKDGSFVDTCPSLGSMIGPSSDNYSPSVLLRHKLLKIGHSFQYNRCYLPLGYNNENGNMEFSLLTYESCKDVPLALSSYKEVVLGCKGYHHINDIMTIDSICHIISCDLPEKYSDWANVSVGKVTTHWPDSKKGDVLFFNEPYKDVNDVIDKPLVLRLLVVEKALERGVCFVFSHVPLDDNIPHIVLPSPMESHIVLCAHIREQYSLKTVGITGSIGKTSTKDMLYNVLKQHYDTDRNLRNTNTQVNIGLHIQGFKQWQQIYIQEIGGGRKGGASRHSRMILPSAACVTNIGDAHIGNHGSREALMINKLGIVDGLVPGGTLYLNGDDPLLSKAKVDANVIYYAINNKNADYYADSITQVNARMHFDICHGQSRVPIVLNVLGEHNVLNAVCCYAIAQQFGLSDEEIQVGLAQFKTSGARQNLIQVHGYKLFVDCFNASPASIDSSLSVLDSLEENNGKKIAVIGDVTGMASMAKAVHQKIGHMVCNHHMDMLVCYGKNSREVYRIAKDKGIDAYTFTKPAELISFLKKNMSLGDTVLFKGSSKMKLAQIIDQMFGTMFSAQMFADSAKTNEYALGGIDYSICPAFATVTGYSSVASSLKLGDKVKGKQLRNIGEEAFMNNLLLESIVLGNELRHIGDRAFAGCTNLKDIYLPDGLMYLGDDVFDGCPDIRIHCKIGSNAYNLCQRKNIKTI